MRIVHLFYQEKKYGGSETFYSILKNKSRFEHDVAYVVRRGTAARFDQTAYHFIDGFTDVISHIDTGECDVLQAHFFIPAYLAQKARVPVVLISHCLLSEEFKLAVNDFDDREIRDKTWEAYTIFSRYEKLWYPRIEYVVTLSRFHTKELTDLKTKTTYIRPILDLDTFSTRMDTKQARSVLNLDEAPTLLFCARPTYYKGLHILLEAFNMLKREYKDLQLVVVGENFKKSRQKVGYLPAVSGTSSLVWKWFFSPYTDSVVVRNNQESRLIPLYFTAADVVVCPSLYESFGYVNIEALACGTPVVASHTGGIPEIVVDGYNGLLFERGNPHDLKEKINVLLRDEEVGTRLAANGLQDVVKYDAQEGVKKMDNLYEVVCR